MIRVLDRASRLISLLAAGGGGSLRTLAAEAGLPAATATRLLHTLVELGWADQDGPRGDYRPGPRLAAIAAAEPYRHRLLQAARAPMRALAHRLGCRVALSVLRGDRRLVVWACTGAGGGFELAERDDLVATASGRLLLAHLPAAQRRRLAGRVGPLRWRGIADERELESELRRLRRDGWAAITTGAIAGVAAVLHDQGTVAALGLSAPRTQLPADAAAQVRAAAAEIAVGEQAFGTGDPASESRKRSSPQRRRGH